MRAFIPLIDPETGRTYEAYIDTEDNNHQIWITLRDPFTKLERSYVGIDVYDGKVSVVLTTDNQLNVNESQDPDHRIVLVQEA